MHFPQLGNLSQATTKEKCSHGHNSSEFYWTNFLPLHELCCLLFKPISMSLFIFFYLLPTAFFCYSHSPHCVQKCIYSLKVRICWGNSISYLLCHLREFANRFISAMICPSTLIDSFTAQSQNGDASVLGSCQSDYTWKSTLRKSRFRLKRAPEWELDGPECRCGTCLTHLLPPEWWRSWSKESEHTSCLSLRWHLITVAQVASGPLLRW